MRLLVYNVEGKIIEKPFRLFKNHSDLKPPEVKLSCILTEKLFNSLWLNKFLFGQRCIWLLCTCREHSLTFIDKTRYDKNKANFI